MAGAFTPDFPGTATELARITDPFTTYRLPIGPFADDQMQTRTVEGALDQTAWRIALPDLTTLRLLVPLREQLAADGWTIIYECETDACGGFDFRYGANVLPEPDMHVDLSDFRFLAAERQRAEGPEYVSLMVSRSTEAGFVQLIHLRPEADPAADPAPDAGNAPDPALPGIDPVPPTSGLIADLQADGHAALDDLVFASGSATLAPGAYASLDAIAAYLRGSPDQFITLVGHTDATGSLQANITLSRRRAESVRDTLITDYDLPEARIVAEGVGYLAPRAPNQTAQGRTANRRVEVVLTFTP